MRCLFMALLTSVVAAMLIIGPGCSRSITIRDDVERRSRSGVYFEATGKGPPVILLHGGQMDRRIWDEQVALLSPTHRVIRCDLRGYGRTGWPTTPFAHWRDVDALMDELGVTSADVVGLSLGGQAATDLSLMRPQRVRRLVLVAPGMGGFDWSADAWKEMPPILAAARDGNADRVAELWLNAGMMRAARDNPHCRDRIRFLSRENVSCWLANPLLECDLDPPAAARLREIRARTLVIVGDRDVPDMQRIATKIEAEVPGARRIVIPGAGHIVNMEAPETFNRELVAFLDAP